MSAEDLRENSRPRWLTGCAIVALLGLLLPLAACRLGEAGIRRNLLHAPQVDIAIGGMRLFARTIDYAPMCDTEPAVCAAARVRGVRLYIVWADIYWPGQPRIRHYPIISIPLEGRGR